MSTVNTIDLFCGGGGLSLGFERFTGSLTYRVTLAIDNDAAAVRCFNANHVKAAGSVVPIARVCDITWFHHIDEIRLFYLVHLALAQPGEAVRHAFDQAQIPVRWLLRRLAAADGSFERQLKEISSSVAAKDRGTVDRSVFSLAMTRSIFSRLSMRAGIPFSLDRSKLAWAEESKHSAHFADTGADSDPPACDDLVANASNTWAAAVDRLRCASEKVGKGINAGNSARLKALLSLFDDDVGAKLQASWCGWRAQRDSIRADFCLRHQRDIRRIYESNRVQIVLGGPPCKGFSRIGRPVIESLRDQGVHAWSDLEFGDERNALMCQYVLFLRAFAPDFFLFENVSNFQSALKTPNGVLNAPDLLSRLIADLSGDALHYTVQSRELNAKNFAVPQDRRRFLLAGIRQRDEHALLDGFFEFDGLGAALPLGSAISGLPKPVAFQFSADERPALSEAVRVQKRSAAVTNSPEATYLNWIQPVNVRVGTTYAVDSHLYRVGREDDRKFLEYVAPGIRWMDLKVKDSSTVGEIVDTLNACLREIKAASRKGAKLRCKIEAALARLDDSLLLRLLLEQVVNRNKLPGHHLLEEGYLSKGTAKHGDWFERLAFTKPCKTIVAHIGKDTYGFHHPYEARPISVREAARVQSFPDEFSFAAVGVVDAYTIIGNAVPPLMARRLAARIAEWNDALNLFDSVEARATTLPQEVFEGTANAVKAA